jgi:hypothetical protein
MPIHAAQALLSLLAPLVDVGSLARADWSAVPDALPVLALAFVYQNVAPVVATGLGGEPGKVGWWAGH